MNTQATQSSQDLQAQGAGLQIPGFDPEHFLDTPSVNQYDRLVSAYSRVRMSPEKNAGWFLSDARRQVKRFFAIGQASIKDAEQEKAWLDEIWPKIYAGYMRRLNDHIVAISATYSTMVVGPAKVSASHHAKRRDREHRVSQELSNWIKLVEENIPKWLWKKKSVEQKTKERDEDREEEKDAIIKDMRKVVESAIQRNVSIDKIRGYVRRIYNAAEPKGAEYLVRLREEIKKMQVEQKYIIFKPDSTFWSPVKVDEQIEKARTQFLDKGVEPYTIAEIAEKEITLVWDRTPYDQRIVFRFPKEDTAMQARMRANHFKFSPSKGQWQRMATFNSFCVSIRCLPIPPADQDKMIQEAKVNGLRAALDNKDE